MPEITARMPCPVCVGTTMEKVRFGVDRSLEVDHCRRCGGIWFDQGEVQQMRSLSRTELGAKGIAEKVEVRARCHDCHASIQRDAPECEACGWSNVLACPSCDRSMRVETHAGLRLDVCRTCKGVWFDHHELEAIWGYSFALATRKRGLSSSGAVGDAVASTAYVGADVLSDVLFWHPGLAVEGVRAAGHMLGAGAQAASEVPGALAGAIGAAPEMAGSLFEAVGEAAGSVFGVIIDIIAGIFD